MFNSLLAADGTGEGIVMVLFVIVSVAIGVLSVFASIVQFFLYFNYHRSNRRKNHLGCNGEQVARKLLDNMNMTDIQVKKAGLFRALIWGNSYSARKKTVFLRRGIINRESLTATAVAAQKVGVAVLDVRGDKVFKSRYFWGIVSLLGPTFVPVFLVFGVVADIMVFETVGAFSIVAGVISLIIVAASAIFTYVQIPIEKKGVEFARQAFQKFDMLDEEETEIVEKYYKAYILDFKIAFLIKILEMVRAILRIILKVMQSKATGD